MCMQGNMIYSMPEMKARPWNKVKVGEKLEFGAGWCENAYSVVFPSWKLSGVEHDPNEVNYCADSGTLEVTE